jgi:hypothetical protein
MLIRLSKQLLAASLPVESGIYDTGTEIKCHTQLTPEQRAQFDVIVDQWRDEAPKAEALNELWTHVNNLYIQERVSKGWDENASGVVTLWAALGEVSPARAAILADVQAWGNTAWMTYYQVKALLEAGKPYELPALPAPCPWHFADCLFADSGND